MDLSPIQPVQSDSLDTQRKTTSIAGATFELKSAARSGQQKNARNRRSEEEEEQPYEDAESFEVLDEADTDVSVPHTAHIHFIA